MNLLIEKIAVSIFIFIHFVNGGLLGAGMKSNVFSDK